MKLHSCWLWLICVAMFIAFQSEDARAQPSTGTIAGVVRDDSGAVAAGAEVMITNGQTGIVRTVVTSDDGRYAAALLAPGTYTIEAQRQRLRSVLLSVVVQAGTSSTIDLSLRLGALTEAVTVRGFGRLSDDHHHVAGWVDRAQIESQPLNGRNVLELAKVEPGVTGPARVSGGRVFIAPLGAGLNAIPRVGFTRVTVDGANIETPGTVGTLLQVSPDAVQQLQVSTASLDLSLGLATSGAVDIVSRSGGNAYTVGAFSLYRDRRWSASPGLDAVGPIGSSPPFRRSQAGAAGGGPLRANRAFFFAGYERHNQHDVIAVVPADPEVQALGGTFASPYAGTLMNVRFDVHLSDRHRAFLRHTHDANNSRTPGDGTPSLPSAWVDRKVRAHQTLASLTSSLSPSVVNELRVSFYSVLFASTPVASENCPPPCIGFGAPRIQLSEGGPTVLTLGTANVARNDGQRFQVSDALVWHKGPHVIRFGFDWEHSENSVFVIENDPVTLSLWSPSAVRQRDPSMVLPSSFRSTDDFLQLPLRGFTTSVGSGEVLQRGFQPVRRFNTFRWYAADRWNMGSRLTLNGGLAWSFEPGVLNDDLRKPDWLAPLVGSDRLAAPASAAHLSGSFGAAWKATADARTVVRAGIGRYLESMSRTVALNLATERALLSPLGTVRLEVSGSNISWNGRRLHFTEPTTFTGADLLAILPGLRATIGQSLRPDNRDFSVINLDQTKEGRNLYDPSYTTPRAVHASVGVERDVGGGLFISADLVWKRFSHTFINGIDYNRFFSAQGPIIPACTAAQRTDVAVICSNGSLYFDTTTGRARYRGLLVRGEKRFGQQGRILASYALGSFVGNNGTGTGTTENPEGRVFGFNNDNWSENFGPLPTDIRHVLNVSGMLAGPAKVGLSFNLAAYSRAPFSAYVAGMDFNGDGTTNDLLPGTRVNQFNRGLNEQDLTRLVAEYNSRHAGKLTPGGQVAPTLTLPDAFAFNDNFLTLDVRLTRSFRLGQSARLSAFVDVFNVFNTMNLTGYSGNLSTPGAFGRPGSRVGQAFGSGGPRSAQLGLRAGF